MKDAIPPHSYFKHLSTNKEGHRDYVALVRGKEREVHHRQAITRDKRGGEGRARAYGSDIRSARSYCSTRIPSIWYIEREMAYLCDLLHSTRRGFSSTHPNPQSPCRRIQQYYILCEIRLHNIPHNNDDKELLKLDLGIQRNLWPCFRGHRGIQSLDLSSLDYCYYFYDLNVQYFDQRKLRNRRDFW